MIIELRGIGFPLDSLKCSLIQFPIFIFLCSFYFLWLLDQSFDETHYVPWIVCQLFHFFPFIFIFVIFFILKQFWIGGLWFLVFTRSLGRHDILQEGPNIGGRPRDNHQKCIFSRVTGQSEFSFLSSIIHFVLLLTNIIILDISIFCIILFLKDTWNNLWLSREDHITIP